MLSVSSFRPFWHIDEADNQDENDYYELSQGEPIHYDIDADEE